MDKIKETISGQLRSGIPIWGQLMGTVEFWNIHQGGAEIEFFSI